MMALIAMLAEHREPTPEGVAVATLTIRGLDETTKARLRLEAARQGYSMEEAARQILRRALVGSEIDAGGLGGRVHRFFVEADSYDLDLPDRSYPRAAPGLLGR
jgi:hypothetical protein